MVSKECFIFSAYRDCVIDRSPYLVPRSIILSISCLSMNSRIQKIRLDVFDKMLMWVVDIFSVKWSSTRCTDCALSVHFFTCFLILFLLKPVDFISSSMCLALSWPKRCNFLAMLSYLRSVVAVISVLMIELSCDTIYIRDFSFPLLSFATYVCIVYTFTSHGLLN